MAVLVKRLNSRNKAINIADEWWFWRVSFNRVIFNPCRAHATLVLAVEAILPSSRSLDCSFFFLFVFGIENVDYFLLLSPQAAAGSQRKVT